MTILHRVSNRAQGILEAQISASDLSLVVESGHTFPSGIDFPCWLSINDEIVEATAFDSSTRTFTLGTRAVSPTSAAIHGPGSIVALRIIEQTVEEIQDIISKYVALTRGDSDGIFYTDGSYFEVTASGTPDMNVQVALGYAIISSKFFWESAAQEVGPFTAPSADDRIDIVQATLGVEGLNIKQGTEAGSPTAPSADADSIILAEVYLRPAMTSIEDTDDATNGYITDKRGSLWL